MLLSPHAYAVQYPVLSQRMQAENALRSAFGQLLYQLATVLGSISLSCYAMCGTELGVLLRDVWYHVPRVSGTELAYGAMMQCDVRYGDSAAARALIVRMDWYHIPLSSYDLSRYAGYGVSGTELGYAATLCYAVCGTELACGATLCYAVCGTELAYGATLCYAVCGTELAYGATRRDAEGAFKAELLRVLGTNS
eukprot:3940563-Rhodomonas_salina.4